MKNFKKIVAVLLTVAMAITLMPQMKIITTKAASDMFKCDMEDETTSARIWFYSSGTVRFRITKTVSDSIIAEFYMQETPYMLQDGKVVIGNVKSDPIENTEDNYKVIADGVEMFIDCESGDTVPLIVTVSCKYNGEKIKLADFEINEENMQKIIEWDPGVLPEETTPEVTTPEVTTPEVTTPETTEPEGPKAEPLVEVKDAEYLIQGSEEDGTALYSRGNLVLREDGNAELYFGFPMFGFDLDHNATATWSVKNNRLVIDNISGVQSAEGSEASQTFTGIAVYDETTGLISCGTEQQTFIQYQLSEADLKVLGLTLAGQEETTPEVTTPEVTTPEVTTSAKVETTTKAPQITTKTPAATTKTVKATVKKATKKKAATTVKISLKKVKNAKRYQVQIAKSKKFNKKNIIVKKTIKKAKLVKKASFTIKSKKIKNKKKLYVRAKVMVNNKYGAWSKPKKIQVKK